MGCQKSVIVDSCEVLILEERTVVVVQKIFVGIQQTVKATALFHIFREAKIPCSNDPRDNRKQPPSEYSSHFFKDSVPEVFHPFLEKTEKIRLKISRLNVAELRRKSSQGWKWEMRSAPF